MLIFCGTRFFRTEDVVGGDLEYRDPPPAIQSPYVLVISKGANFAFRDASADAIRRFFRDGADREELCTVAGLGECIVLTVIPRPTVNGTPGNNKVVLLP